MKLQIQKDFVTLLRKLLDKRWPGGQKKLQANLDPSQGGIVRGIVSQSSQKLEPGWGRGEVQGENETLAGLQKRLARQYQASAP